MTAAGDEQELHPLSENNDDISDDGTDPQTSDVSSDIDFDMVRDDYQSDRPQAD